MKRIYCIYLCILYVLTLLSCRGNRKEGASQSVPGTPASIGIAISQTEATTISTLKEAADTSAILKWIKEGKRANENNPDSAFFYFEKALRHSLKTNYSQGTASALLNLGSHQLKHKRNYLAARKFFLSAIPYCILSYKYNPRMLSGAYSNIGNTYSIEGQYDSAIHYYYKSLSISQNRPQTDTQSVANTYLSIGIAMESMDENESRALEYCFRAYNLAKIYQKDTLTIALSLENLGALFNRIGKHDSALYYCHEALQFYQQLQLPGETQEMYAKIGATYLFKQDLVKAKSYFDSAVNIDPRQASQNITLQQNLGYVQYYHGNFKNAIDHYQKALKVCYEKKYEKEKLKIYSTLSTLHDTIGQKIIAYEYLKKFAWLRDTMLNEDRINNVNHLEIKYRTSEKDKEIIQKQLFIVKQHSEIQQQYLWIGAILFALLVILGILYRRRHKATIAQLKAKLAGEEKERLRMASELHDGIVSKLSFVKMSFDALAPSNDDHPMINPAEFRETLQSLEQSIVELRTTSQNLQPSILKKMGLLSAVQIYCQQISKISRINIDFQQIGHMPPLQDDFQLHIYRMIQELVNNILKHAQATYTLIQFNVLADELHITVEDNGIGINQEQLYQQNGIGWHNLQDRLKILNGTMEVVIGKGTALYFIFDLKHHTL